MAHDQKEMFDDIDQVLHAFFPHQHRTRPRVWRPPTDVFENEQAVVIKVEVAGMNPDDIAISFIEGELMIRGNRRDIEDKLSYHCMEIPYGEFQVEVFLPGAYAQDNIEARYVNGFLYVVMPKMKQQHRVAVHVQKDDER